MISRPRNSRWPEGRGAWLFALALAYLAPRAALAHGASGEALPANAPPVTKDGEAAAGALAPIEADPAKLKIASKAVGKSKRALGRAHGAKLAKDDEGARLLSLVALAWAKAADAAVNASGVHAAADKLAEARADLTQKLSRAKMLLAEHDARRLTLVAAVAEAEKAAAERKKAQPAPKKDPKAGKPAPSKPAKPAQPVKPAQPAKPVKP